MLRAQTQVKVSIYTIDAISLEHCGTVMIFLEHYDRVDHNIVEAGLPRPYNVVNSIENCSI